jgi:stage II sporulation protein E
VLEDALASQQDDFWYDEELCEEIRRAMLAMDLRTEGVVVFGKRRRQIVARGVDATASTLGAAAIRRRLEQVCGFSLGELSFDLSDTGVTMRVSTRPRFAVRTVTRTAAAGGGICGDTVNVFHSERELSYALISDGMGSGAEAAFTSGMCSLFLEKMLMAGNRGETALRMLNSMIRQKGGGIGMECSATVDLMELDLICGRAVFLKSGAAPTYVRRDDSLFRLHARTAPIGILRSVDAQRLAYDVAPGDVIIMLSDGVAAEDGIEENGGECVWLLDLLSDGWEEDMDSMADVILRRAREEGSADDLSVILIRVEEAFE